MKLIGQVNGVEISFDFCPPNSFNAVIPSGLNGTCIIQLKAVDDAGNETNQAGIYMLVDFQKMTFKKLDSNYVNKYENSKFSRMTVSSNYSYKELVW